MKRNSFKRIVYLVFVCTMLVSLLSGIALADVIFEPEDDFYKSHSNECQNVNRDYYANDESGYLEIFSKPDGTSLGFADNGNVFHVQFTYMKTNEVWGLLEYSEIGDKLVPRVEGDYKSGWIKMSSTVTKYDYISFEEDHKQDYKAYEGDYLELSGVKNIVIWTFPHSGESSGTLEEIDSNFAVESVYIDSEGLEWGYVGYYYAIKNFWICLSDPTNTNIPASKIETPVIITPEPGAVPKSSTEDMTTVIIISVAAVVLVTAVLIALLGKHKTKTHK